jgi:4-amino-4-deoxy-L-arabinose transferase-like glycosyltransferase
VRGPIVGLLGICLLTFFAGLGSPAIADSDEAFYAEGAREMIESGDWLTPRFNYIDRFEKPILYYWLAAASYLMAGVNEAAARFPSAFAGGTTSPLDSWPVSLRRPALATLSWRDKRFLTSPLPSS